jgi:hypothetical protein
MLVSFHLYNLHVIMMNDSQIGKLDWTINSKNSISDLLVSIL